MWDKYNTSEPTLELHSRAVLICSRKMSENKVLAKKGKMSERPNKCNNISSCIHINIGLINVHVAPQLKTPRADSDIVFVSTQEKGAKEQFDTL